MRPKSTAIATIIAAALSAGAADALAFNCYEIIDKDQNFVYRAVTPPFGMAGEHWEMGQQALPAQGLPLRWQFAVDFSPSITQVKKAEATTKSADVVFDPNVVLRSPPEYMTATGRPTPVLP